MSNIVPLRSPRPVPDALRAPEGEREALTADLFALAAALQTATRRAGELPNPALQEELTVQSLHDALSAVERAARSLGAGSWERR